MKRILLIAIPSIILGGIAGYALPKKATQETLDANLIEAYKEYHFRCEELLDYIAFENENFHDSIMETDFYYDYEVARERLEELNLIK